MINNFNLGILNLHYFFYDFFISIWLRNLATNTFGSVFLSSENSFFVIFWFLFLQSSNLLIKYDFFY